MIMWKEHNDQNKRPAGPYNSLVKTKKKKRLITVEVYMQN